MKKLLTISALCISVIMLVTLCACGNKVDTKATEAITATIAETSSETLNETIAATSSAEQSDDAASGSNSDDEQSGTASSEQEEYMTQQKAVQDVVEKAAALYGDGDWRVESFEKTTDPDGIDCYYIGVVNYSNPHSPTYHFYTDGQFFCYEDEDSGDSDSDSYISKEDALAKVRLQAGSGAEIIDAYKGYTPDGTHAWVVTVSPITASEEAVTVTYYVGYMFCYSE